MSARPEQEGLGHSERQSRAGPPGVQAPKTLLQGNFVNSKNQQKPAETRNSKLQEKTENCSNQQKPAETSRKLQEKQEKPKKRQKTEKPKLQGKWQGKWERSKGHWENPAKTREKNQTSLEEGPKSLKCPVPFPPVKRHRKGHWPNPGKNREKTRLLGQVLFPCRFHSISATGFGGWLQVSGVTTDDV